MKFLESVVAQAKANVQTIVLPESEDSRVLEASARALEMGIARIMLIGDEAKIKADSRLKDAIVINAATFEDRQKCVETLYELRKSKGMTMEEAEKLILGDPLFFGIMLVKLGYAGGMVAGAVNSTANVLRPALQILRTAPGTKLVSAAFLMEVPNCELGEHGVFIFSDCALNPNPTSEELAHIAVSSAETFKSLVRVEPRIAMLSFSTKGSGKHADVDKVVEATRLAKELRPDLLLDGELQLDAAIVPEIGQRKAPGSVLESRANVFIFPDLDAGNIGYKLVQRFANAEAYGPICQGLAMPVNDLSRGATVNDIVGTIALTALQSQMSK